MNEQEKRIDLIFQLAKLQQSDYCVKLNASMMTEELENQLKHHKYRNLCREKELLEREHEKDIENNVNDVTSLGIAIELFRVSKALKEIFNDM